MRINVVYESYYGNGKKIAEDLCRILESKGADVSLFPVAQTSPESLPKADRYVFSAPTRKFALPPGMSRFLDEVSFPSKNVKYGLMTTYLDPRTIALGKMARILDQKGAEKGADDFKVRVSGLRGPVKEDITGRLCLFAEELLT